MDGFSNLDPSIQNCVELLSTLVSFDTTSRESNLALIDFVVHYLDGVGASIEVVRDESGRKANLIATIGPMTEGGIVLSGHTDVVPVDQQAWETDPFRVERIGDRLVGRGVADMKGFLACALAAAPLFGSGPQLMRPVHFAFSYDEELGCLGAQALVDRLRDVCPRPSAVIVGEPTSMRVVGGHKGALLHQVCVRGFEAHSSLPNKGLSANMAALRLAKVLLEISDDLKANGDPSMGFDPIYSSLTVGEIHGGTAPNILAGSCELSFDLRYIPRDDPSTVLAPFFAAAASLDEELRSAFPTSGVTVKELAHVPAFAPEEAGSAERLTRALTGDNGELRLVPYGSEAGFFQKADMSVVICGPGSIEQAHQPNEYIEIEQLRLCMSMMGRLAETLSRN
jgi:acetylornithine deacetylase